MYVSSELWGGWAVSLEGSVDNIGTHVVQVWHHWLVHWTVPWDVSWLSHSVSVASLVVLVEDWRLSSSPLSVGIWHRWVLWENSSQVPPEHVWVVQECSGVELMVVHNDWSFVSETSTSSSWHEEEQVSVWDPASNVEILNWKLSNNGKTQKASDLSSGSIVGPVPVWLLNWSDNDVLGSASWEPGGEDVNISLSLWGPWWQPLLNFVGGQTKANKVVLLDVIGDLVIDHSSLPIIESVLFVLGGEIGRSVVLSILQRNLGPNCVCHNYIKINYK